MFARAVGCAITVAPYSYISAVWSAWNRIYFRPASANMASSRQFPQLISVYLAEEGAQGRIVGPLPTDLLPSIHISRFGLIPKKTPGEWRLIVDLSSPDGVSLKDGICDHFVPYVILLWTMLWYWL